MSAAEVEGGEGHIACVKNALYKHEKALYPERHMCYDTMLAAHAEKQQCQSRSLLEWATGRNAVSSWSSSEVKYSPTQPSVVMVESVNTGNACFLMRMIWIPLTI